MREREKKNLVSFVWHMQNIRSAAAAPTVATTTAKGVHVARKTILSKIEFMLINAKKCKY